MSVQPPTAGEKLRSAALAAREAGLCVLPAKRKGDEKRVALPSWKAYQERLPSDDEVNRWFRNSDGAMCIVGGTVSGNLETLDFDLGGEAYGPWARAVESIAPDLLDRLVVESTPSGGLHVVYRCVEPVAGNTKLAQRRIEVESAEPVVIGGKEFLPRQEPSGKWVVAPVLIETRGEGGVFLCAPSEGYQALQGDLCNLPVITAEEREILLSCARALDEMPKSIVGASSAAVRDALAGPRPGDDFNQRGDPRPILIKHGWTLVVSGENEHWCRPGKDRGTSATLKNGVLYVFSTNATPFEAEKGYSPFAVYAILEHNGDFTAAASALRAQGYGVPAAEAARPTSASGTIATPPQGPSEPPVHAPLSVGELVDAHPRLRPPVVEGLLREGETMNVIAPSKTGKSWLTLDFAIAVATGTPWLDRYETVAGDVLIIDNELHRETSANRVPKVAAARGIAMERIRDHIFVENLRGQLRDIFLLEPYFCAIEPGRYKVIILDAFYRFMPVGGDENDNGTMASIYNLIDRYAERLGCCFVMIHHSTKGNQSGKSVTDVGAGAGAQSRAADAHLILRPHEEPGTVVLDAAVRSWPPIEPVCLRWLFPVWNMDESLDPANLRKEKPSKRKEDKPSEPAGKPQWTAEMFVKEFIGREPLSKPEIREATQDKPGLSWRRVNDLIEVAERQRLIHRWTVGKSHKVVYSTQPQSLYEEDGP
ncbi:MAG: AAA family ATPase [Phycisphaerales bacterium]|nr:AAA family ATPase [Phycisphaerales bacterium]